MPLDPQFRAVLDRLAANGYFAFLGVVAAADQRSHEALRALDTLLPQSAPQPTRRRVRPIAN